MNTSFNTKQLPRARRRSQRHFSLRRHTLAEPLAEMLLFFFLSLSECFHLPSPFAVCALSAYLYAGKRLLFPALGLAASLALRSIWHVPLDAWQYIACAAMLLLLFKPPQSMLVASACSAAALSLRVFALIFSPSDQQAMILSSVSMLTGALCTPAICHAVSLYKRTSTRVRIDDVLCCLVLCTVMLSGAGRVAIGPVNIGFVLSGAAILIASCIGGCSAAVCAGLLAGIALSLCGHTDGYVVCFAFSGIVTGLFYGRRRLTLAVIYLLCCTFTAYAIRFSFDVPFILAGTLAGLIFLIIPQRLISAAFAMARSLSPDASDNEAAYAQSMRTQWTANIARLAQLLPDVHLSSQDDEERLEAIANRLCAGCDLLPQCWHDYADETREAMRRYFLDGDRACVIPDCLREDAWPIVALENERSEQQRALRSAYAQREREATRTHLSAISEAMSRLSDEGGRCDHDDEVLLGEAAYLLRRMHIAGKLQYALRISRHVCVSLRYEPQYTRQRQLERYGDELSRALGVPLYISQHSKDTVLYEEAPPLFAECFHLSASAGDGDGINGDAVLTRTAPGGTELTMLSDGMGHGSQAHDESGKTLELLSLCIDSGYSIDAALSAINAIMLTSTDGEQYATVDLCVTDLWNGMATLNKLGACPSIHITGSSVRVLESSALPLGILPEVKSSAHTFAIDDGDVIIQFSDGLSDACGGMHALEQQVTLLLHERRHRSPETICNELMSAAMRRSGGVPKDDVTILCTVFKKRAAKKRDAFAPAEEIPV